MEFMKRYIFTKMMMMLQFEQTLIELLGATAVSNEKEDVSLVLTVILKYTCQ